MRPVQPSRALGSGPEGRWFESSRPDFLTKWSCALPHPRRDESGSVYAASEPGQGRRILVLRARKQNGPESRASGTPYCCPYPVWDCGARQVNSHPVALPGTPRWGRCAMEVSTPAAAGSTSTRNTGRLPTAAGGPTPAFGGPAFRHDDGGDPALPRVVVHGGMHARRDGDGGVDSRLDRTF
jgi:hypothetical protein